MENRDYDLSDIETLMDRLEKDSATKKKAEIEMWGAVEPRLEKMREYALEQCKEALAAKEEPKCLYEAVELVAKVTAAGRLNGILGMEAEVEKYSAKPDAIDITKDVLWAVADGREEEIFVGKASEKYWELKPTGYEAMSLYFYIIGAALTQTGVPTERKNQAFKSLLPPELYPEFDERFGTVEAYSIWSGDKAVYEKMKEEYLNS